MEPGPGGCCVGDPDAVVRSGPKGEGDSVEAEGEGIEPEGDAPVVGAGVQEADASAATNVTRKTLVRRRLLPTLFLILPLRLLRL